MLYRHLHVSLHKCSRFWFKLRFNSRWRERICPGRSGKPVYAPKLIAMDRSQLAQGMPYHPVGRAVSKRSRSAGVQRGMLSHYCYRSSAERGGCSVISRGFFAGGQITSMNREFCCINPGGGYSCTQSPSVPSSPKESISKLRLILHCWWRRMASG